MQRVVFVGANRGLSLSGLACYPGFSEGFYVVVLSFKTAYRVSAFDCFDFSNVRFVC